MKSRSLRYLVGAIAATFAMSAMATLVTLPRYPNYHQDSFGGGEFTMTAFPPDTLPTAWTQGYAAVNLVNNGFQTFCLELNEGLGGQPFLAVPNPAGAVAGGTGGGNPDPISKGTALLYMKFATGTLPGYNFTPGPLREQSAVDLQKTIWWLEDEQADPGVTNPFRNWILVQFAGNVAVAKANHDPVVDGFTVMTVNMYAKDNDRNYTVLRQDMLVYLPDGGLTIAMLGLGMIGLATLRRTS